MNELLLLKTKLIKKKLIESLNLLIAKLKDTIISFAIVVRLALFN